VLRSRTSNPGETAVITAEKCRLQATECKTLASSIDVPTQRSLEQSIMALNWEALADQIDHHNSQATQARLLALFAGVFRPLVAYVDFRTGLFLQGRRTTKFRELRRKHYRM
jgi:hypothetical protein